MFLVIAQKGSPSMTFRTQVLSIQHALACFALVFGCSVAGMLAPSSGRAQATGTAASGSEAYKQLIEQALKLDPVHLKSLILAGTAAYNRGDFAKAVVYWDRAGKIGPPDDPMAQQARAAAAEARVALSLIHI